MNLLYLSEKEKREKENENKEALYGSSLSVQYFVQFFVGDNLGVKRL